ncbi:tRNA methyltransferase [Crassisporium funariophilum]|nr:tRNA methyltransferase [Crassisporium funariophilum]
MASSDMAGIEVPDGFRLHTERSSHILLSAGEAFLNPVQEFNRDTSVACIRVWSEELDKAKEARWIKGRDKKVAQKNASKKTKAEPSHLATDDGLSADLGMLEPAVAGTGNMSTSSSMASNSGNLAKLPEYQPYKFVILEALSATGLRSIRYAKEIPLVKSVIANDLSPAAVDVMKRNVKINGLGDATLSGSELPSPQDSRVRVEVNEGDACSLMYNHRELKRRVDVVDLDPYGTAAPFIDAAVQCVNDGGLLCVTCTDLAVLATTNFPEKCFSNYGGVPVKAEYCHESALRLLLHTISTSASRYGRFIEPLISLSIDFYIRVFVRIQTSPIEVKKALTKTSTFYVCTSCQSFHEQPLGKIVTKVNEASGNTSHSFKTHAGPLIPEKCTECESTLHLAGPMWSGPLHSPDFIGKVLVHLEANLDQYGTSARMKGMLTVAKEELQTPFYFTPTRVASFFHCTTPSLDDVASALLNGGHRISRSHACAGSLKTTATHRQLHDVFRSWVKLHPVKLDKVSEHSPTRRLLSKEPLSIANFAKHPDSVTPSAKVKLVRYQETPKNWGPGTRASSKTALKRKRSDGDPDEPSAKR